MIAEFLFRGVSEVFHQANGGLLKPKVQGPFSYKFHWDEPGLTWDSGATWDSTPTNAVIRHQLNQEGFPTSGISTTQHLERAILYARGKNGISGGRVFKVDRRLLLHHGIAEFEVAQYCVPSIPEDGEVILAIPDGAHLPPSVIVEIIQVPVLSR